MVGIFFSATVVGLGAAPLVGQFHLTDVRATSWSVDAREILRVCTSISRAHLQSSKPVSSIALDSGLWQCVITVDCILAPRSRSRDSSVKVKSRDENGSPCRRKLAEAFAFYSRETMR